MASVISNKTSSGALTNSINPISGVVNAAAEMGSLSSSLVGAGVTHSAEVLDMPVDPNEPTYCLCNQVSYGEMIGCDNPDVSIFVELVMYFLYTIGAFYNQIHVENLI